jgi:hypothetical protein
MQDTETKVVIKDVPERKVSPDNILLATDFSPLQTALSNMPSR